MCILVRYQFQSDNPPLVEASHKGHFDIVEYLLDYGVDIESKNEVNSNMEIY